MQVAVVTTASSLTCDAGQVLYQPMPCSQRVLHLPSILPTWRYSFCTSDHSKRRRVLLKASQCHLFIEPVEILLWGKVELRIPLGLLTSLCTEEEEQVETGKDGTYYEIYCLYFDTVQLLVYHTKLQILLLQPRAELRVAASCPQTSPIHTS